MLLLSLHGWLSAILFFSVASPSLLSLQEKFKSVKAFEVRFKQVIKNSGFPDAEGAAEGFVKFTRPDHLIWTYEKPEKKVLTYKNRELIVEEGHHKELIHTSGPITLEESFSFLWGEPDSKIFKIKALSKERFKIEPRQPAQAQFKEIDILVKGGLVSEARVTNHLGGESLLQFADWNLNSPPIK